MKALIFRKPNFNLKDLPIQKLNSCRNPRKLACFRLTVILKNWRPCCLPPGGICVHTTAVCTSRSWQQKQWQLELGWMHSLSCSKSPDFPDSLPRTGLLPVGDKTRQLRQNSFSHHSLKLMYPRTLVPSYQNKIYQSCSPICAHVTYYYIIPLGQNQANRKKTRVTID